MRFNRGFSFLGNGFQPSLQLVLLVAMHYSFFSLCVCMVCYCLGAGFYSPVNKFFHIFLA
jgi:hypothetical protein